MNVLNSSADDVAECPLCMEPLEVDDLNFYPCTCGYQICRFCWHRIRTDENELCPACRKAYPENPADFKPLSQEQVNFEKCPNTRGRDTFQWEIFLLIEVLYWLMCVYRLLPSKRRNVNGISSGSKKSRRTGNIWRTWGLSKRIWCLSWDYHRGWPILK